MANGSLFGVSTPEELLANARANMLKQRQAALSGLISGGGGLSGSLGNLGRVAGFALGSLGQQPQVDQAKLQEAQDVKKIIDANGKDWGDPTTSEYYKNASKAFMDAGQSTAAASAIGIYAKLAKAEKTGTQQPKNQIVEVPAKGGEGTQKLNVIFGADRKISDIEFLGDVKKPTAGKPLSTSPKKDELANSKAIAQYALPKDMDPTDWQDPSMEALNIKVVSAAKKKQEQARVNKQPFDLMKEVTNLWKQLANNKAVVNGGMIENYPVADMKKADQVLGISNVPIVTQKEFANLKKGDAFIAADDPTQTVRYK